MMRLITILGVSLLLCACGVTKNISDEARCYTVKEKRVVGMSLSDGTVRWNHIVVVEDGSYTYVSEEVYNNAKPGRTICAEEWIVR